MRRESTPAFLVFTSVCEWRAWLAEHHAAAKEVWLLHPKKGSGLAGISVEEAVEEALCFGWIDGLLRRRGADAFLLRYSPRKPGSVWAANNIARVEKLMREGRMTEAGMRLVEAAKASGEWQAAARREDVADIPAELAVALRRRKGALAGYRSLPASRKKQYMWWLESAKSDETRAKRIDKIVVELAKQPQRAHRRAPRQTARKVGRQGSD